MKFRWLLPLALMPVTAFLIMVFTGQTGVAQTAIPVEINIDISQGRASISPYIYGSNQDLPGFTGWMVRRLGGNRLTGYNWENNASNAGSDWQQSSDTYLCDLLGLSSLDCARPGAVLTKFHDTSVAMGARSLITLQMAGYVAADKRGTVSEEQTAPSPRWKQVVFVKGAPFATQPDPQDDAVYMDELVHFLVEKYGGASNPNGVWAYSLDNEPGLWVETHPRLHPEKLGAQELITRSVGLARAVKSVDLDAQVFGPALYGFWAYMTLQDAPDWEQLKAHGQYEWFIDYYLGQMLQAEQTEGKRLLDVLDVHWYSEARGDDQRVVFGGTGSEGTQKARLQAPRTLWDESYQEVSWIADSNPQMLPVLPALQSSIDQYYPGTLLAFSEWGFGGESHISGGLAAADVLGIFGKYGVYQASHWSTENKSDYIAAAYRLYRDYDGQRGVYGNTKVWAETSDNENSSVYASVLSEDDSELHIILLNKNFDHPLRVNVDVQGESMYTKGEAWGFDQSSSVIRQAAAIIEIKNNRFVYDVPPLTVYHYVLRGQPRTAMLVSMLTRGISVLVGVAALAAFLVLRKRSLSNAGHDR